MGAFYGIKVEENAYLGVWTDICNADIGTLYSKGRRMRNRVNQESFDNLGNHYSLHLWKITGWDTVKTCASY